MKYYAYHRTSTKEQKLDRGITAINKFCEDNNIKLEYLATDQQTGKDFDRPDYQFLKKTIDVQIENDNKCTLIVSELDRLGRNKELTLKEIREFQDKGVRLMILEIPTTLTDYSNFKDDNMAQMMMETINNMLIEMYASFAHAEMEKRAKRQSEGIAEMRKTKEWNKYGRPMAMKFSKFCKEYERVINGEVRPFELMKELELTKSTFYRYKKQYEEQLEG